MGFLTNLRRYDKLWIGIVLGLILPAIFFYLTNPLDANKYGAMREEFNKALLKLLPILLSRCIFPNALLFFLLLWSNFENTAKGVLYTTVGLTGILILIQIIF